MKVLLVSNMYPDKNNPQFGVFVKNSEEILINNNISVEKVVCTKKKGKLLKVLQYISFYIKALFKILINKYDCIYVHYLSHSSLPIIIAKKIKRDINIISNAHGSDVVPENRKHAIVNSLAKKLVEISDIIIVPSNYYKNVINTKWGVNFNKIKVFPSGGVNSEIFYPQNNIDALKKEFKLSTKFKYIGFVGRLDKGKGWDIFLDAIKELSSNDLIKHYKFIFVGNGNEEEAFKKRIKELGVENVVIHFGFFNHSQLSNLYNCLELFCFPTLRESESLGLVGLEALACGIPVIASNFAGPTDYIKNNYNGYLFEKGNSKDLCSKIQRFIFSDEYTKNIMKKFAYESSKLYWSKNIKNDLIDIFTN